MKAVVRRRYGPPDLLRVEEIARPEPGRGQVLVRVRASAVNPGDSFFLNGVPYIVRLATGLFAPKNPVLGIAVAGVVETVGAEVSGFRPGDEVFAELPGGGFAEFAVAAERALGRKPAKVSFEAAAAVPVVGVAALQALRDVAKIRPGQSVLVNGAAGGVGTFAVQIGKWLGAEVTGVCGPRNVDLLRSIGAHHVIDYTREDFSTSGRRYDLIFDNVGNRRLRDYRRALAPKGMFIPNSNSGGGRLLGGFIPRALQAMVVSPFVSQRLRPFSSTGTGADLDLLAGLIVDGTVTPVIDRVFPLAETAAALRLYREGHSRGKIIVAI